MNAATLVQSLLKTTWFAGNPFFAALLIGLLARFGGDLPLLAEMATGSMTDEAQITGVLSLSAAIASSGILNIEAPWWMVHEAVLVGLAVLAFVRFQATRDPNFEQMSNSANQFISPVCDGIITYGLVDSQSAEIMQFFVSLPHPLPGSPLAMVWLAPETQSALPLAIAIGAAVFTGFATWLQVQIRNGLVGTISAIDVGGHLGLMRLYRLAESSTVAVGILLVVFLPLVALALALATLVVLLAIRGYFAHRERALRVPCPSCNVPMHRSSLQCAACRTPNPAPLRVGLFGQATSAPVVSETQQRHDLIGRHRCPSCAAPFKQSGVNAVCAQCGTAPFPDISALNVYVRAVDRRQLPTYAICAAFGLIPVLGIVPALITYQLSMGASLGSYLPVAGGCLTRWGLRLFTLAMLPLQATPLFGALVIPVIMFVTYRVQRRVLTRHATAKLPQTAAVPAGDPLVS